MTSLNSSYYTAINTQHEKLGFDFLDPKTRPSPRQFYKFYRSELGVGRERYLKFQML